jgi:hypothetical protein
MIAMCAKNLLTAKKVNKCPPIFKAFILLYTNAFNKL